MEGFVAAKLEEFTQGKISRRRLLETLTVAATTAYAKDGAKAASSGAALKVAWVDHISYTCPNFGQTADWYSKFFNLEQVDRTAADVVLPFRRDIKGYNAVIPGDLARTHLVIGTNVKSGFNTEGAAPRRKSRALVNHIAYTIADFDQARVRSELIRLGFANPRKDGEHSFHIVDLNGFDVQISGVEMSALKD